ncbi:MAG: DinB family protein [Deltaproteobacteria bacterium]|jgi:hypothetical protein|nr:DinB family protein [Deltaproteobacteria bacterium]
MSRDVVESQRGNFEFAFSLLLRFVEVCPDDIWNGKFGGWPIWQQVYHSINALDFFVAEPGAEPAKGLVSRDIGSLSAIGEKPVSKADMRDFASRMKAAVDAYIASLTDASLSAKAEGASLRMGRETKHAGILVLLASHIFYHLGSCDAALRERGLKGVF